MPEIRSFPTTVGYTRFKWDSNSPPTNRKRPSYWSVSAILRNDRESRHQYVFPSLPEAIMDWLETTKKTSSNECITQEVAGQAYLENYALKLFTYADKQDREANFGKCVVTHLFYFDPNVIDLDRASSLIHCRNVVKAFYTSGILYDVMMNFGELTDEVQQNRKYAKWKAAYIHKCLKDGTTPIPGPMTSSEEGGEEDEGAVGGAADQPPAAAAASSPSGPPMGFDLPPPPTSYSAPTGPTVDINPEQLPTPPSEPTKPPGGFRPFVGGGVPVESYQIPVAVSSNVTLSLEQTTQAQKYCKFASNSLNFGDLKAAVENLHKALRLIQTGQEV